MLTPISTIVVTDTHTGQPVYRGDSGWIVSERFAGGAPSSPFTVFLQSPTGGAAWDGAHLHQIGATGLAGLLRGIRGHEAIGTAPPLVAFWP